MGVRQSWWTFSKFAAESRASSWFLVTVGVVWYGAAVMKALTLASGWENLDLRDPVTGIAYAWLFAIVSPVEALLAAYLLFGQSATRRLLVCTGVTVVFLVYRVASETVQPGFGCGCFGKALTWFGISEAGSQQLAFVALAYSAIGATFIWFAELEVPPSSR
jgi:hypothetical protein